MLKTALYIIILVIAVWQPGFAQSGKAAQPRRLYTIPFQLTTYNNISVQAVLNGTDTVQLMFHTAADALALTEQSVRRLKSVRFDAVTDSIKSWGGQANSSRLSKYNSLQIADLRWDSMPIWEDVNSGQFTDGKFGLNIFKNRVVEVCFDSSMVKIYPGLPAKAKNYEKFPLLVENGNMFIEASCVIEGKSFKNKFLIHSGYSGAVLLDDRFVQENGINEKLQIVGEKILKDAYGNSIKTRKAILPVFKIGRTELTNVPAGFFEGTVGRQKMSIIGGDILKRFNMIIDAERKYIYLQPGKWPSVAYTNS